jgi:ribosomal protein S18 acetylase RimI-like enzyme
MFARADLPNGISLRPTRSGDRTFESELHAARRDDLWLADASPDYIHSVIEMQERAQTQGYGQQRPNALYYVIERTGTACGRLVIDFDAHGLRIVDLALLPAARGKGIADTVLAALQRVAAAIPSAITLSVQVHNTAAFNLYIRLGFVPAEHGYHPAYLEMIWRPAAMAQPAEGSAHAASS